MAPWTDWFWHVGLGVLLGGFSKMISSFGLVLQKRAHKRMALRPPDERKHFCADLAWVVGFLCYFGGNLINIAALALAPQSIIAALDALVPVFTSIYAPKILNEKITCRQWQANFVIVVGVGLIVGNGPQTDDDFSDEDLVRMIYQETFLIWMIVCHVLAFAGIAIQTWGPRVWPDMEEPESTLGRLTAVSGGVIPALLSSFLQIWTKIFGDFAGNIMGKGQVSEFTNWRFYMFLFLLLTFNTLEVFRLQRGLMLYRTVLVVTSFQVCLVVFAVVGGGLYFHEFDGFGSGKNGDNGPSRPPLFGAGLCLAVFGVIISTLGAPGDEDDAEPAENPLLRNTHNDVVRATNDGLVRSVLGSPGLPPMLPPLGTPDDLKASLMPNVSQDVVPDSAQRYSSAPLVPAAEKLPGALSPHTPLARFARANSERGGGAGAVSDLATAQSGLRRLDTGTAWQVVRRGSTHLGIAEESHLSGGSLRTTRTGVARRHWSYAIPGLGAFGAQVALDGDLCDYYWVGTPLQQGVPTAGQHFRTPLDNPQQDPPGGAPAGAPLPPLRLSSSGPQLPAPAGAAEGAAGAAGAWQALSAGGSWEPQPSQADSSVVPPASPVPPVRPAPPDPPLS